MKKLCPQEFAYQLTTSQFTKLLVFHLIGSCKGYIQSKGIVQELFTIVFLEGSIPTVYEGTQTEVIWKSYTPGKLTYKIPTTGLTKLLEFNLLGSCLGYTIEKFIVQYLFNIVFLKELSNVLQSDSNGHRMQKLCVREVDISTYHIRLQETFVLSCSRLMFRVHYRKRHGVDYFFFFTPQQVISNNLSSDQSEDHM